LAKGDIALLSYSPGGSTRCEVGTGKCIQDPSLGKGRFYGVSDGTIRKSDGGFLYGLSIVAIALSVTIRSQLPSNVSDAQISREWVKGKGKGEGKEKLGKRKERGVDNCTRNFDLFYILCAGVGWRGWNEQ